MAHDGARYGYKGPFKWNAAAGGGGRYIDSAGRFVKRQVIRAYLDGYINNTRGKMSGLAISHYEGRITLGEFQRHMIDALRNLHLASAALARGGWAQLTPSDLGKVGNILYRPGAQHKDTKGQYQHLADLIKAMTGNLTLPQLQQRLIHYFGQGRGTYHDIERRMLEVAGFDEEIRIRHSDDSCETSQRPGCIEQADLSWQPIGTLVTIGKCSCLGKCLCTFGFRNTKTGAESGTDGVGLSPKPLLQPA